MVPFRLKLFYLYLRRGQFLLLPALGYVLRILSVLVYSRETQSMSVTVSERYYLSGFYVKPFSFIRSIDVRST